MKKTELETCVICGIELPEDCLYFVEEYFDYLCENCKEEMCIGDDEEF